MGIGLSSSVVGMSTLEFDEFNVNQELRSFDFVYHGGLHSAKGIRILNNWLRDLVGYSVLIPYALEDVKKYVRMKIILM